MRKTAWLPMLYWKYYFFQTELEVCDVFDEWGMKKMFEDFFENAICDETSAMIKIIKILKYFFSWLQTRGVFRGYGPCLTEKLKFSRFHLTPTLASYFWTRTFKLMTEISQSPISISNPAISHQFSSSQEENKPKIYRKWL
jgi:hypothetical protein